MSSVQTCCIIHHAITVNWKLPWCQLCPRWWHRRLLLFNKITPALSLTYKIYWSPGKNPPMLSLLWLWLSVVLFQLRLANDLALPRPSHACFEHVKNIIDLLDAHDLIKSSHALIRSSYDQLRIIILYDLTKRSCFHRRALLDMIPEWTLFTLCDAQQKKKWVCDIPVANMD